MKKNIMLLIGNLSNGGAERSIINLANSLALYHNVILVSASTKRLDYNCNVKIIEINEFRTKKKKIIGIYKLKKLKKQYNIDVTISYTTSYNFFNTITKVKDKTIISVRNHLSTKKEGLLAYIRHKISIKMCDKIVCCSNSVMNDQLVNYHATKNKLTVITNFCDLEFLDNEMKAKLSNDDKQILKNDLIVTIARLVPHKGHKHIIKAMSLVVKKFPKAKLLIFSRGPLKEELELLVKKYNLESNVIFMGFHNNPFKFVKEAKCFVLASDYEGFPNVIIEAMACGCPVVATDAPGGTKEILCDKYDFNYNTTKLKEADYGYLIPSFIKEHDIDTITKNEKALADAIMNILDDKDKYDFYHKQSLLRAKKYNKEKIINQWLDIIK